MMRLVRFVLPLLLVVAAGMRPASATTRLVLMEEFTQWNCPPCAAANPGLQAYLSGYPAQIIGIRYHAYWPGQNNDPMYLHDQTDHYARIQYYQVNGVPGGFIDGASVYPGDTSACVAMMNDQLRLSTPLSLSIAVGTPTGNNYPVTVTATSTAALSGNLKLRAALVQSEVDAIGGTNGETVFENVVQKMYPNASGQSFSINAGETKQFNVTYASTDGMDYSKCFFVVWVQDDDTKEVLNCETTTDPRSFLTSRVGPNVFLQGPSSTATYTMGLKNRGTSAVDVDVDFDNLILPPNWNASFKIDGTVYTSLQTVTLPPSGTKNIEVDVQVSSDPGIAVVTLGGSSTAAGVWTLGFEGIVVGSTNCNTVLLDGDGGGQREQNVESAMGVQAVPFGVLSATYTAPLLSIDTAIHVCAYVAGPTRPSDGQVAALTAYLNAGGNLYISGDITANQLSATSPGLTFMQSKMHTAAVRQFGVGRSSLSVQGITGDPVSNGISSSLNTVNNDPAGGLYYFPMALRSLDANATPVLKDAQSDTVAGMKVATGVYKAVFLSTGIETFSNQSARNQMWQKIAAFFSPTIAITQPTTTTNWNGGSTHAITWTEAGVGTVKISCSTDNGTTFTPVASGVSASSGSYQWQLPALTTTCTVCFVKVEEELSPNGTTGRTIKTAGPFTITAVSAVNDPLVASAFTVAQNYPNPALGSTEIAFTLPSAERVTLAVYDVTGVRVATVLDEVRAAGVQHATFDAGRLPAGTYEYRLSTPVGTITRSLTLLGGK